MIDRELLHSDRVWALNLEEPSPGKIRIGVLFVECFTASPVELAEYRFELPKEMTMQPVARIAAEMEFELLEEH